MIATRVLLAAIGITLLRWTYVILDNIWTYNDSGTVRYIFIAAVPGLPGLLCLYLAFEGPARPS